MNDKKTDGNPLSDFLRERASVVISDLDHPGGLDVGEVLAWRHWFAARQRRLQSSGGRPTNPRWTIKRQIPFSPETWEGLERRAEICGAIGPKIGPGQMAAFLLEEAVSAPSPQPVGTLDEPVGGSEALNRLTEDPQFDEWDLPAPFTAAP